MKLWDEDSLFSDEYNAIVMVEYQHELELVKRLIYVAEEGIERKAVNNIWSYEGICYAFAKAIVKYSKMAYDNFILGHTDAVNMINRVVLENCVFLDIIVNNEELELWKYYIAHSYRSILCKKHKELHQKEMDSLNEMYHSFHISEEFYVKQENQKKAYISMPYGWTYKINKDFSFSGVCKLVGEAEYMGFKLMSEYSHGTSLYLKIFSSIFEENIMNMLVSLYIELYRMVILFCYDTVDESFDEIAEELESIFYRYIAYEEEVFGNNKPA